jgi:hypothetical protein
MVPVGSFGGLGDDAGPSVYRCMSRQFIAATRSSASWALRSLAVEPRPSVSARATAALASRALPYATF